MLASFVVTLTQIPESNEPTAHHEQAPQGAQAQAKEPEDEETQLEAELALVTRMKDKWERELGLITTKKTALELQLRNLRAKRELAATREELEWWRKYGPMLQDWDQGRIDVQALREVFDMEGLKEMLRRHEDGA